MKKNIIKAVLYIVGGFAIALLAILGMIAMFLSSTFLPVYVGASYVIVNRILRYALYAILLVVIILSICLADYGMKFLIKKFHKNLKGRC